MLSRTLRPPRSFAAAPRRGAGQPPTSATKVSFPQSGGYSERPAQQGIGIGVAKAVSLRPGDTLAKTNPRRRFAGPITRIAAPPLGSRSRHALPPRRRARRRALATPSRTCAARLRLESSVPQSSLVNAHTMESDKSATDATPPSVAVAAPGAPSSAPQTSPLQEVCMGTAPDPLANQPSETSAGVARGAAGLPMRPRTSTQARRGRARAPHVDPAPRQAGVVPTAAPPPKANEPSGASESSAEVVMPDTLAAAAPE